MIKLEDLTLYFHSEKGVRKIFDNTSLILDKGIYFLTGENGSGKSSLFKLITGELTPSSGNIIAEGKIFINKPIDKYKNFSVMKYFKRLCYKREIVPSSSFIDKVKRIFLLNKIWNTKISKLSKGDRQIVALLELVFKDYDIILLDEALSALSKEKVDKILKFIFGYYNDKIIIYIDHSKLCTIKPSKELNISKHTISLIHNNDYDSIASIESIVDVKKKLNKFISSIYNTDYKEYSSLLINSYFIVAFIVSIVLNITLAPQKILGAVNKPIVTFFGNVSENISSKYVRQHYTPSFNDDFSKINGILYYEKKDKEIQSSIYLKKLHLNYNRKLSGFNVGVSIYYSDKCNKQTDFLNSEKELFDKYSMIAFPISQLQFLTDVGSLPYHDFDALPIFNFKIEQKKISNKETCRTEYEFSSYLFDIYISTFEFLQTTNFFISPKTYSADNRIYYSYFISDKREIKTDLSEINYLSIYDKTQEKYYDKFCVDGVEGCKSDNYIIKKYDKDDTYGVNTVAISTALIYEILDSRGYNTFIANNEKEYKELTRYAKDNNISFIDNYTLFLNEREEAKLKYVYITSLVNIGLATAAIFTTPYVLGKKKKKDKRKKKVTLLMYSLIFSYSIFLIIMLCLMQFVTILVSLPLVVVIAYVLAIKWRGVKYD